MYTLFKHATILNNQCDGYLNDHDVLVQDQDIVQVGKDIHHHHATIIDVQNRVLMPGFIDAHAHVTGLSLSPKNAYASLEEVAVRASQYLRRSLWDGFTSLREAGGADYTLAKLVRTGVIQGPRLFVAGKALTITGGGADFRSIEKQDDLCCHPMPESIMSTIADGITEVQKSAREELRKGADHIKIFVSGGVVFPSQAHATLYEYTLEEIKAIVYEANARNTYVLAHAYTDESVRMCLDAGVKSVEHANYITEDTVKLMKEKEAVYDPTFISLVQRMETAKQYGLPDSIVQHLQDATDHGIQVYQWAKQYGVPIALGTDLWGLDAQSYQLREITHRASFDSADHILQSVLQVNASLLPCADKLGSIQEGKYADIIILDGNPLEDIKVLQKPNVVKLVMKNGIVFKDILSSHP